MCYNKHMSNKTTIEITDGTENGEDIIAATESEPTDKKPEKANPPKKTKHPDKKKSSSKKMVVICLIIAILVAGGVTGLMILLNRKSNDQDSSNNSSQSAEGVKYYSRLSGLEIASDNLNDSPIFCVQVPNGADGARPHAGLNEAAIVYEAIAEAGITRFAAVFQNPKNVAIGPIRSLRLYYLEWDTPLGCTIVHAGGADDAIAALRSGGYNDIDEGAYNWRDSSSYIAPNNLFTDAKNLNNYAKEYHLEGTGKNAKVYPRLLPAEAKEIQANNLSASKDTTDSEGNVVKSTSPLVSKIAINFGGLSDFNTRYTYDPETGLYTRSYESGEKDFSYRCTEEIRNISRDCISEPVTPSTIVAMEVDESLDDDNYHQVIETIGSGTAYIFQNGEAHKGTWAKSSRTSQIFFKNESGNEISFAPGQLWIAAIPRGTGSVEY